ncbi:PIN domain-containing protein [Phytoactinopolyspora limicola]|uniref:PIN domain-containing protein n=1 Tax=Phytoactinopolyspora limicola TaxID=2715536 RepID=UPI00140A5CC3|nr:PIN domain-containing protein [Phytoactinopolyspora limicola]
MIESPRGPVVVDTGVYGATMTPSGKPLASGYRQILEDRRTIISFVTVAELRFGASLAGWGARRRQGLEDKLDQTRTVWATPNLITAYVDLRSWAIRAGHGLGQKDHEADRWVAATAIHLGVPLVAHDSIFFNVEDLQLITKLPKLGVRPVSDGE